MLSASRFLCGDAVTEADVVAALDRGWFDAAKALLRLLRTRGDAVATFAEVRAKAVKIRDEATEVINLMRVGANAEATDVNCAFQWAQRPEFIYLNVKFSSRIDGPVTVLNVDNEKVTFLNDTLLFEATGRRTGGRGLSKGKAVEMEDIKFHQCVRLARFENDRTISFIPPDGEFELMSYRLNTQVKPLLWIEAVVEPHSHSRIEYMIKAKSQFKQRSTANNVEIVIPVPPDADTPSFKTSIGSVKYAPERDAIVWTIKQFHGGKEYLMRAHFGLPSVSNEEDKKDKPPITVKFEIPYFTVSGIQVRYLKIIEKSGYQALPWVRYITQNGDYQLRMS